jgi:hypothetical protein
MTMQDVYTVRLKQQIDLVFKKNPDIYDHRNQYPWLTGFLGNPFSGIWFIAENPSLIMVEKAASGGRSKTTEEAQWCVSRGDLLFREMLVKYGFKNPPKESPGGWNCYITDVIKQTDYVSRWHTHSRQALKKIAEIWSGVVKWELENSHPRLVVCMGKKTQAFIAYLEEECGLVFPETAFIHHYSYIAFRPQGNRGPMNPDRVKEYEMQIAEITERFRNKPS